MEDDVFFFRSEFGSLCGVQDIALARHVRQGL